MIKLLRTALAIAALAAPVAVHAELKAGATAPAFHTQGALGGKDYAFDLTKALRHGPVVLYFYPKAFTSGCTAEAHAFAEAAAEFAANGAQVIGMSGDDLVTLRRFSTEECRSKFPVAVATPAIIKAYDVPLSGPGAPADRSNRTSYVISQNGRISFVHSNDDYRDHVRLTLAEVKALHKH